MNRNFFIWGSTLAPLIVAILTELQGQLEARAIDLWALGAVATGAAGSLVVGLFHLARAATERTEALEEVATGVDQDSDDMAETPAPSP
jgi:hypothetical protein